MTPHLSLVIPVFNEEGNLTPLLTGAVRVLEATRREFEIILVNDGSTDGTADEIAACRQRWPQCREVRRERRGGQAAALFAGLQAARGEIFITMDGDGQNDPADVPALLEPVESGQLDVACGWRQNRHDTRVRRVMSRFANTVRRRVLNDRVHDAGCQLRVMRREILGALYPMELMQSFLPALAVSAGFRVGERPVRHHPRQRGESKFGLGRLWWRPAVAMLGLRWRMWRRRAPGARRQPPGKPPTRGVGNA